MPIISYTLRNLLRKNPIYIYLIPPPVFFFFGAGLEFTMIKWRPNGINFCESNLCERILFKHIQIFPKVHLNDQRIRIYSFILDDTYKKNRAKEIADERLSPLKKPE